MAISLKPRPQGNVVSAEDIVESVADRAGVAVSAVKNVLEVRPLERLELLAKELAAKRYPRLTQIPRVASS